MEATEDEKRLLMFSPPAATQEHPWLVIHHGKHRQLQTFYSISDDRCYVRKIPQLCNKLVCTSHACGWLVLEHLDSDECFLFNLLSMEKIQLPQRHSNYDTCVLTAPPSDPNCRVVFTDDSNRSLVFCRPGDSEFYEQGLEHGDDLISAVAFEGKFYGLRRNNKTLVVLDFSAPKPEFREIVSEPLVDLSPPDILKIETYMIESCGELLLVIKMWHGLFFNEVFGFLIFRVDFFGKTWVKVKSIGDRAIFLDTCDGNMSFSATKDDGIRGNCIYFTGRKDRCLYAFDLENQRISISLPSPTVSRRDSALYWVMMPSEYHP